MTLVREMRFTDVFITIIAIVVFRPFSGLDLTARAVLGRLSTLGISVIAFSSRYSDIRTLTSSNQICTRGCTIRDETASLRSVSTVVDSIRLVVARIHLLKGSVHLWDIPGSHPIFRRRFSIRTPSICSNPNLNRTPHTILNTQTQTLTQRNETIHPSIPPKQTRKRNAPL